MTVSLDLPAAGSALPPQLEAHEPPEASGKTRDAVRLLVSRSAAGELSHHDFTQLPELLLPGDLLVVNNSATLPAAIALPDQLSVHFSTAMPAGDWLVELRSGHGSATVPFSGGTPGQRFCLPGGAVLTLTSPFSKRLWHARLSTAVIPYLMRFGAPIRYAYVPVRLVDRCLPDRVRDPAGQRGNAECRQAIHARGRDQARCQGRDHSASDAAHRRVVARGW